MIPGPAVARAVKLVSGTALARAVKLVSLTAGITAVAAGCAAAPSAPTVSGKTLSIYLSAPASLASNPQAQDVVDAEKLAYSSACTSTSCPPTQQGGFTLHVHIVSATKISDNARTAIEDKQSVAYLGEATPGDSVDSLGITNGQDLLQVSPTEAPSVPQSDFESFSTYGRTFASIAPMSDQDLRALAAGSGGKAFVREFRTAYGHSPASQAILGYAAMSAVQKTLQQAGSGVTNRGTVRNAFFALKNEPLRVGSGGPQIGTYTVNKDGTVTITPASGSTTP